MSSDACSDWASAYVTTEPEEDGYYMDVHGHLPSNLTGTYFRSEHHPIPGFSAIARL